MAVNCPNYSLPEVLRDWNAISEKLGESSLPRDRRPKTMKLWMDSGDDTAAALAKLNPAVYSPREKFEKVEAVAQRIQYFDAKHEYKTADGKNLESVSRELDKTPNLKYMGDDAGTVYADSGTSFHAVVEAVINASAGSTHENARKIAYDAGIPESFTNYFISFIGSLKQTGRVVAETKLSFGNIAGRTDILHYKDDGTIDIYDLKTAFRSPSKVQGNKKIWNPVQDQNGRKAHRYATQLEYYGRIVEAAVGHPVSNLYILPVEISFVNNVPGGGFDTVNVLPAENTEQYGYQSRAREIVDKSFGYQRTAPLPRLFAVDDSNDLISTITGSFQNMTVNLDQKANDFMLESRGFVRTTKKGFKQFLRNGEWASFKNQTDRSQQKLQVIDEVLSAKEQSYRDLAPSLKNFIDTGNDIFLDSAGDSFKNVRAILTQYINQGYQIHQVKDVEGFGEDKMNWFVIRKNNNSDLIYIGNEELSAPFSVFRSSSLIGSVIDSKKSVFGNLGVSWTKASYDFGSELKNNIADARKVEATLIALKMKEADSSLKLDRILVMSLAQKSPVVHHTELSYTLPIVQKLFNDESMRDYIPSTYRSLAANKTLFDAAQYEQDWLKGYMDMIHDSLDHRDEQLIKKGIEDFNADKINNQQITQIARDRLSSLYGNEDPESVTKMRMLAEFIAQMEGITNNLDTPTSIFEDWLSMSTNVRNEMIQKVVHDFKAAVARVREKFFQGYKKESLAKTKALFDSSSTVFSKTGDWTISNTTKYYSPLLQKDSFKVRVSPDRTETREMVNFNLVQEGSSEFNALTKEQQDLIVFVNDSIEKAAKKMNIDWVRGRLPLMSATFYNKWYKARSGQSADGYSGLLDRAFADMEGNFSTGIEGDGTSKSADIRNRFANQQNGHDSDSVRNEMLGITPDKEIDPNKHARFETNLEVITDLFVMEAIRVEEFNKANQTFQVANTLFNWYKTGLLDENITKAINWLDIYQLANIHQRDRDAGTTQSKVVNAVNKIASLTLITKPAVGVANYLGQQGLSFTQAIANSIGGSSDFGVKDWTKAGAIVGMTIPGKLAGSTQKIDLLLEHLGLFNLSYGDMVNGHRRYGNRSFFRLKNLYGVLNAGDWMARAQVMVAQMLKHGNWDAYSVVDGKLVYDENLDGRFNGNTLDIAKGRALKKVTYDELEQEGKVANGRLLSAYGTNEALYFKNLADTLAGSLDRDSRALFSFTSWTKLFGLFKSWMPARLNQVFDKKFNSRISGSYQFIQKPDGEYTALWTGKQMEGIYHTIAYSLWYMKEYRKSPAQVLTPAQKNNLNAVFTQVLMLGFVGLGAALLDDDDDGSKEGKQRKKDNEYIAYVLSKTIQDTLTMYKPWAITEFLTTPPALIYFQRLGNQVLNIGMGKKNINESTDAMIERIPLVNWAWPQFKKMTDNEDETN